MLFDCIISLYNKDPNFTSESKAWHRMKERELKIKDKAKKLKS